MPQLPPAQGSVQPLPHQRWSRRSPRGGRAIPPCLHSCFRQRPNTHSCCWEIHPPAWPDLSQSHSVFSGGFQQALNFLLNCKASQELGLPLGGAGSALHNVFLLGSKGTGKQGNVPPKTRCCDPRPLGAGPWDSPVPREGILHVLGLSHASRPADCVSQEHMFTRKPGLCLSQRAHPTISLSAEKVRNGFSYPAAFRRLGKRHGERAPWKTEAHPQRPINKATVR